MPEPDAWSILPALVAIGLALVTRQVIPSLLCGIWIGWVVAERSLVGGTVTAVDELVGVFSEPWRTKVIVFTLLVGSLLLLLQRGGGIEAFVTRASRWRWAQTRRGAQLMAWLIGLGVFVESNITCLVTGTVARPLFDRLKLSREKLAWICDSTSAPVCIMLPLNGWGATVLGLLLVQEAHLGGSSALTTFLLAIPFNFYAWIAILVVLVSILTGRDFGPMAKAERRAREEGKLLRDGAMPVVDAEIVQAPPKEGVPHRLVNMLVPLLVMVIATPVGIVVTGRTAMTGAFAGWGTVDGWLQILDAASGSTAVLWAVGGAVLVAAVMLRAQRAYTADELVRDSLRGAGGVLPLAVIMTLAFGIGMVCEQLQTGKWVAGVAEPYMSAILVAPLTFVVAGIMAFSTGTSWGTFAVMIPLAMPLAAEFDSVSAPLVLSAVLGGAVFGDHCSPISDTTVVSSMAACSDHVDHVRTQLPYALFGGAAATTLYLLAGL